MNEAADNPTGPDPMTGQPAQQATGHPDMPPQGPSMQSPPWGHQAQAPGPQPQYAHHDPQVPPGHSHAPGPYIQAGPAQGTPPPSWGMPPYGYPPNGGFPAQAAPGYGAVPHLMQPGFQPDPAANAAAQRAAASAGLSAAMGDIADKSGLGMFKGLLNFDDSEFWKGALVGAAVVLLVTNDELRNSLIGSAAKTAEAVKSGIAGMGGSDTDSDQDRGTTSNDQTDQEETR